MRNLKMTLALVAVLVMAGTTFAGITITVEQQADPAPGLQSWLVKTTGAFAFEDITMSGVHQVNMDYGTLTPTIWMSDLQGNANVIALDTHFLIDAGDVAEGAGAMGETNDAGNPAGLALPFGPFNKAGMGDFAGDLAFTLKGAAAEAALVNLDFIQVILPTGGQTMLYGTGVDYYGGEVKVPFEQMVGIPEPGTIVMLLAGALCLLVVRFRKK